MFLGSCASTPQVVSYKAEPIEKPALVLPNTSVLELRNAEWNIITPEELNGIFDKLKKHHEKIEIFSAFDKLFWICSNLNATT